MAVLMPVKISVNLNETESPATIQLIIEKAGTMSIMASRKFIAGLKKGTISQNLPRLPRSFI